MSLAKLKQELGNPSEFILSQSNLPTLRKWAIEIGRSRGDVAKMSGIELANLYHENGMFDKGFTPAQHVGAEMFISMLNALRDNVSIAPEPQIITISNEHKHYKTDDVIKVASIAHPIMLVGPAGCGKTTIGEHVAQALELSFFVTSTINDTHELTGFVDGHGKYHSTPFRRAFEHGGVWIADEIDAWDAGALLAANAALANGYANFPDRSQPVQRHKNFRMIATANTFGNGADRVYIGRNELDAASLDRFATITVDYDLSLEQMFARENQKWLNNVWRIRKAVNEKNIHHVVSSRAIIYGVAALEIGIDWNEAEEMYIYKGMSENDREKIS